MGCGAWGRKEADTLNMQAQTDRLSRNLEAARSRPWENIPGRGQKGGTWLGLRTSEVAILLGYQLGSSS